LQVEQLEYRCLLNVSIELLLDTPFWHDPQREVIALPTNSGLSPVELQAHRTALARRPSNSAGGPQAAQVLSLYRTLLHQKPTTGQMKQGVALLSSGGLVQLEAQILGSPTYFSKRAHKNITCS
jgi:hypothetical protein